MVLKDPECKSTTIYLGQWCMWGKEIQEKEGMLLEGLHLEGAISPLFSVFDCWESKVVITDLPENEHDVLAGCFTGKR